jgi:hypothetical protein
MPRSSQHKERNHARSLGLAMTLITLVLCSGVALSCFLSVHLNDEARVQRQHDRAPACLLAKSLVAKEHGTARAADLAIYKAINCPQAIQAP